MPKQKKPTKFYEATTGHHSVSADGSQVNIGGSVFKRIVLPSSATPCKENEEIIDELTTLDSLRVTEEGAD